MLLEYSSELVQIGDVNLKFINKKKFKQKQKPKIISNALIFYNRIFIT